MKIYQVDAFTDHVFGGNPAAICPLDYWLPDEIMQQISMENNLSETAFFVLEDGQFHIRWFTPKIEIDLCGHATLASAHVIFNYLGYAKSLIEFKYGGGQLTVQKHGDLLFMDFPAVKSVEIPTTDHIGFALGKSPVGLFEARDLMAVFESEEDILDIEPDFTELAKLNYLGVIVTAPGKGVDFVSRFFAPRAGINEDPVTGSAHCMLIPYWAERLGKNKLQALQVSKRGGELSCEFKGTRVEIAGKAVTFLTGDIKI